MSKNMPSTITRNLVIVLGMFLEMCWPCGISCYCTRHVFGHVLTVWYFLLLYSACFWTCSDGVVFLVIHFLTLYLYIVKQGIPHRQNMSKNMPSTITRNTTPSAHVQKHAAYNNNFLLLYSACFWTCSDGVVFLVIVLGMFLDMFWRCDISF
jgi:hypothetical protein